MIGEHHEGIPDQSPIDVITPFDMAMRASWIEEDPTCAGCGKPGGITAHWLPSGADPRSHFGGGDRLGLVIYCVCRRCWKRMRRDERFTAKIEARIIANAPTEWETA